ncbi:helix-turn-helix transcriptional regulator [Streptomyces antibioticus]|uniref:helix-turn-helix transcriptional regulator n=1 Tax=Streptomyces antibioticus TaxID=1890 RepID=UPI0036D96FED
MYLAQQHRTPSSFTVRGRPYETGRLQAAWERCRDGRGSVLTLHGPVGSGRTELLDALGEFVASQGAHVLTAAGSPLERDFPLGVVRQLFQSPLLPDGVAAEAARLIENGLAPALAPAWPEPEGTDTDVPMRPTPHLLHRLSSLLLEYARQAPVLLAVDDRQDADVQSLEFLLYLTRRTRGARILTVLCSRENMTPRDPFFEVELASRPDHERVRLRLFGHEAVAELLRERLGADAAQRFAGEVLDLTGGNPLLVRAVVEDQQSGDPGGRLVIGENYRRGVMNCLHRIDPLALRLARGVAALGRPAGTALLAELLLLAKDSPPRALYLLHSAGLFRDGDFRHRSGGGDLLAAMRPAELAALHRRAAELLRATGASAEHVAEQYRAAEGQIRAPWSAETTPGPAPATPPTGPAAAPADPAAGPREAPRPEPARDGGRDDVVIECVPVLPGTEPDAPPTPGRQRSAVRHLFWEGRTEDGVEALARYEAGHPRDRDTADGLRTWIGYWYPTLLPGTGQGPRRGGADAGGPFLDGMRVLTALLAGLPHREAVSRAEHILREGRVAHLPIRSLTAALTVLLYADQPGRAARWCATVGDRTGRGPDSTEGALLAAVTAEAALRQGDIRTADAYARAAFQEITPRRWGVGAGFPLATMVGARTALGRHEDAERYLAMPVPEAMFRTPAGLHYLAARAGHHLATGNATAALADYRGCGETMARWGLDHLPALVPWRIGAARAQLALGRTSAARSLIERQLDGLGGGQARTRGMALRTGAAAADSAERTAVLEQAVQALEDSGDQLELSAALTELSAAHGASGDPEQARSADRRARHLSRVSGAAPAPARDDELSEAERRVAELAASGLTNREIGKKLFITVSTVEQHLTKVYRKLGVRRRMDLARLLEYRPGLAG